MDETDPNVFTQEETYIIRMLVAVSFLSLFGSCFIIFTYVCFKKIRNYAYKLVVYLSFADVLLSIGNIMSVTTMKSKQEDSLCHAQAFLINYGGLASILWTSIIAWSIYSATVLSAKNLRQKNCKFFVFGFGFALILSIIPFITKQYGRAGLYCWIKNDEIVKDNAMRFVQFYIPLWIAIGFNIYAYIKVVRFIKKYISTTLEIRFIHRLKYYPIVLVICWTFATVNRIYNIFGKEILALTFLHVTLGGLQGLLNAFIYGTNDQVKQVWKERICCCLGTGLYARYDGTDSSLKKNEEMQQHQEQEYNNEEGQKNMENNENNENEIMEDIEGGNASVEIVQTREVSARSKKAQKKSNKLAVRV